MYHAPNLPTETSFVPQSALAYYNGFIQTESIQPLASLRLEGQLPLPIPATMSPLYQTTPLSLYTLSLPHLPRTTTNDSPYKRHKDQGALFSRTNKKQKIGADHVSVSKRPRISNKTDAVSTSNVGQDSKPVGNKASSSFSLLHSIGIKIIALQNNMLTEQLRIEAASWPRPAFFSKYERYVYLSEVISVFSSHILFQTNNSTAQPQLPSIQDKVWTLQITDLSPVFRVCWPEIHRNSIAASPVFGFPIGLDSSHPIPILPAETLFVLAQSLPSLNETSKVVCARLAAYLGLMMQSTDMTNEAIYHGPESLAAAPLMQSLSALTSKVFNTNGTREILKGGGFKSSMPQTTHEENEYETTSSTNNDSLLYEEIMQALQTATNDQSTDTRVADDLIEFLQQQHNEQGDSESKAAQHTASLSDGINRILFPCQSETDPSFLATTHNATGGLPLSVLSSDLSTTSSTVFPSSATQALAQQNTGAIGKPKQQLSRKQPTQKKSISIDLTLDDDDEQKKKYEISHQRRPTPVAYVGDGMFSPKAIEESRKLVGTEVCGWEDYSNQGNSIKSDYENKKIMRESIRQLTQTVSSKPSLKRKSKVAEEETKSDAEHAVLVSDTDNVNCMQISNMLYIVFRYYQTPLHSVDWVGKRHYPVAQSLLISRLLTTTRKSGSMDIFDSTSHNGDVLFIPVCVAREHWYLIIIDGRHAFRRCYILDPFGFHPLPNVTKALRFKFPKFEIIDYGERVQLETFQCGIWIMQFTISFIMHAVQNIRQPFRLSNVALNHYYVFPNGSSDRELDSFDPAMVKKNCAFIAQIRKNFKDSMIDAYGTNCLPEEVPTDLEHVLRFRKLKKQNMDVLRRKHEEQVAKTAEMRRRLEARKLL